MADAKQVAEAEAQRNARLQAEGKDTEAWTAKRARKERWNAFMNRAGNSTTTASPNGWNFTPGFYDDLNKMMNGMSPNPWSSLANTHAAMATDYSNQAARRNMEAQAHQRQANYNPYERAGEIAAMKDEDQNRRQMSAVNFAAGSGGTLNRTTNAMDVEKQQDIANQERSRADQTRQQADQMTRDATMHIGEADKNRINSANYIRDRDEAWRRSMGEGTIRDTNTKSKTTILEEKTKLPEEETEEAITPEVSPGNMQAALNYITYGNDPSSGWSKGTKENYDIGKKTAEHFGLQPITTSTYYDDTGSMQPIVNGIMANNPNYKRFGELYNQVTGRNVDFDSTGKIDFSKQTDVGENGYTRDKLEYDSQVADMTGR